MTSQSHSNVSPITNHLFDQFFAYNLTYNTDDKTNSFSSSDIDLPTENPGLHQLMSGFVMKGAFPHSTSTPPQNISVVKHRPTKPVAEEAKKIVPFCFPELQTHFETGQTIDNFEYHLAQETFWFLLTDKDGTRRYGYVLRINQPTKSNSTRKTFSCYVILSKFLFVHFFHQILSLVRLHIAHQSMSMAVWFLYHLFHTPRPKVQADEPSITLEVIVPSISSDDPTATPKSFSFSLPNIYSQNLPAAISDVSLSYLLESMDSAQLLTITASILHERKVLVISSSLTQLSHVITSLSSCIIYPFTWNHVLIPILPTHLLPYVTAPFPYLIGTHSSNAPLLKEYPTDDCVIIDLDAKTIAFYEEDVNNMPTVASTILVKSLTKIISKWKKDASPAKLHSSFPRDVSLEIFRQFWASLLADYSSFFRLTNLIPSSPDPQSIQPLDPDVATTLIKHSKTFSLSDDFPYSFDTFSFLLAKNPKTITLSSPNTSTPLNPNIKPSPITGTIYSRRDSFSSSTLSTKKDPSIQDFFMEFCLSQMFENFITTRLETAKTFLNSRTTIKNVYETSTPSNSALWGNPNSDGSNSLFPVNFSIGREIIDSTPSSRSSFENVKTSGSQNNSKSSISDIYSNPYILKYSFVDIVQHSLGTTLTPKDWKCLISSIGDQYSFEQSISTDPSSSESRLANELSEITGGILSSIKNFLGVTPSTVLSASPSVEPQVCSEESSEESSSVVSPIPIKGNVEPLQINQSKEKPKSGLLQNLKNRNPNSPRHSPRSSPIPKSKISDDVQPEKIYIPTRGKQRKSLSEKTRRKTTNMTTLDALMLAVEELENDPDPTTGPSPKKTNKSPNLPKHKPKGKTKPKIKSGKVSSASARPGTPKTKKIPRSNPSPRARKVGTTSKRQKTFEDLRNEYGNAIDGNQNPLKSKMTRTQHRVSVMFHGGVIDQSLHLDSVNCVNTTSHSERGVKSKSRPRGRTDRKRPPKNAAGGKGRRPKRT